MTILITILMIIIGVLLGLGTAWGALFALNRTSKLLWPVTGIFGGLGSVAAIQLLSWGPTIADVSLIPAIVGAVVLALVSVYGFYIIKNYFHNMRTKN
ncbi:hypothetical protein [Liquorilactobacillus hordei]|nr:hypothetical protein [Liquorilactobacillus hordei]